MKKRYKIAGGLLGTMAGGLVTLALILSYDSACSSAPETGPIVDPMQAIVYDCYGGPDILRLTAVPKPAPADDEVLVKVEAAAVNPLDWHFMRGQPYIMRLGTGIGAPKTPRLGVDFAGTVVAIGSGVTRFQPGDEVFGGRTGAFAEYITVRETGGIALKPANITIAQAAGVGIAGITALQALRDKGQIQAGQKVLINGASGGVGTFAVQIAKAYGAEVTGVCSTRNLDLVRAIGSDHVIDYTQEDYTKSGLHYDLILDNVGNRPLRANRKVLAPEGTYVTLGGGHGKWLEPLTGTAQVMLTSPFVKQKLALFLAKMNQADLELLAEFMSDGRVAPVIDRHYALRDVPAAIAYSEQGHARGKIIIDVAPGQDNGPRF